MGLRKTPPIRIRKPKVRMSLRFLKPGERFRIKLHK